LRPIPGFVLLVALVLGTAPAHAAEIKPVTASSQAPNGLWLGGLRGTLPVMAVAVAVGIAIVAGDSSSGTTTINTNPCGCGG
jgi:hypothetical protein